MKNYNLLPGYVVLFEKSGSIVIQFFVTNTCLHKEARVFNSVNDAN